MDARSQWEFIDRKAAEMGVGDEARRKWRVRGVAHRYRLPILQAAREENIDLDPVIFERAPAELATTTDPAAAGNKPNAIAEEDLEPDQENDAGCC